MTCSSSAAASTDAASRVTPSAAATRFSSAEMNDLASGTSSGSTKLIHGGLRYLEHYEFRLVREALMEREVLWKMRAAHHLADAFRAALRQGTAAGLAAAPRPVPLRPYRRAQAAAGDARRSIMVSDPAGKPLKPLFNKAFEYSDGWVDDARLVVLNARDAADRGADHPHPHQGGRAGAARALGRRPSIEDSRARPKMVQARLIVNAAGPWVDHVLRGTLGQNDVHNVRLVARAATSSSEELRQIRAPISSRTPTAASSSPSPTRRISPSSAPPTRISPAIRPGCAISAPNEIDYLCAAASEYFAAPVRRADIVWSYSGVRPLYDDGASQGAGGDARLRAEGGRTARARRRSSMFSVER